MKKSAKVTLLSYNRTDDFVYDATISEMTFLKRDSAAGVFAWVI